MPYGIELEFPLENHATQVVKMSEVCIEVDSTDKLCSSIQHIF